MNQRDKKLPYQLKSKAYSYTFLRIVVIFCIMFTSYLVYAADFVPVFNKTPLAPYQHAKDFSWITGKLQYVGVYGPSYVIVYQFRYQSKFFLFKKKDSLFVPPTHITDGDYVVLTGNVERQTQGIFVGDYYLVDKIMLLDEYNQYIKKRQKKQ